jgi:hypothetical protein
LRMKHLGLSRERARGIRESGGDYSECERAEQ